MTKYWLAGVTAFAMMTGAATAQSTLSDTTTTVHSSAVSPASPTSDGTYKSTKTQKVIDSNGVETEKTQSYTAGGYETNASASTKTVAPDGSVLNATHEEHTVTPTGETTTTTRTTTNH